MIPLGLVAASILTVTPIKTPFVTLIQQDKPFFLQIACKPGVVVTSGAYVISQAAGKVAKVCGDAWNAWNESSDGADNGNTNPYNGPVDEPVIVVNGNGTGIPIGEGESIGSSPDGKWQEVKDRNGNRTGTRVDAGHPKTHDDPRARGPHGHRDGVTNSDGTHWLPW